MPQSLAICGYFKKHQTVGGWASFFQNLLRGIDEACATDPEYRDLRVALYHNPEEISYHSDRFEYRPRRSRLGRFGTDTRFGWRESQEFDAALFPNYFRPPVVRAKRDVVVIHDLLYKHFPELLPRRSRIWLNAAESFAIRRASAIVTISETVKQDVLRCFGNQWESKIHPIWNPIAFERLDGADGSNIAEGRPYLLGVAVDRPHKNLHTLVEAFSQVRSCRPDLCLVLVGELRSRRPKSSSSVQGSAAMPSAVDRVRDLKLDEHVKITGFISDAELGALYRGAEAFVLPSLFEGFGMPAIEALASGSPTLVSDIPVFREVTLGKAHFMPEPRNAEAVARDIEQVLAARDAARPTAEAIAEIRRVFAPLTIAREYLRILLDR